MKTNFETKLLIALVILLLVDTVGAIIKSDFSLNTVISSILVRGSTLAVLWIITKAIK